MITTAYIIGEDEDGFSIWSKYDGLAKEKELVDWTYRNVKGMSAGNPEDMVFLFREEVIEGPLSPFVFDKAKLFVLGQPLYMN